MPCSLSLSYLKMKITLSDISKNIENYLNQTGLKYNSYIIRSIEHWEDKVVGGDFVCDVFVVYIDVLARDAKDLIRFTGQIELSIDGNGNLIHFELYPKKEIEGIELQSLPIVKDEWQNDREARGN